VTSALTASGAEFAPIRSIQLRSVVFARRASIAPFSCVPQVLNLQIRPHNRFTVMCDVTVPDVIAASCVLQHLHRRKIGSKRILVTISQRLDGDITSLR